MAEKWVELKVLIQETRLALVQAERLADLLELETAEMKVACSVVMMAVHWAELMVQQLVDE